MSHGVLNQAQEPAFSFDLRSKVPEGTVRKPCDGLAHSLLQGLAPVLVHVAPQRLRPVRRSLAMFTPSKSCSYAPVLLVALSLVAHGPRQIFGFLETAWPSLEIRGKQRSMKHIHLPRLASTDKLDHSICICSLSSLEDLRQRKRDFSHSSDHS